MLVRYQPGVASSGRSIRSCGKSGGRQRIQYSSDAPFAFVTVTTTAAFSSTVTLPSASAPSTCTDAPGTASLRTNQSFDPGAQITP